MLSSVLKYRCYTFGGATGVSPVQRGGDMPTLRQPTLKDAHAANQSVNRQSETLLQSAETWKFGKNNSAETRTCDNLY
jgi:hypothetical protein